MSFWNNQFKTHILEPLYFTQNRVEFRLPENKVWNADLILSELGCIAANANRQFPATTGFWELVKNMYLYSDNVELAHLRDVPKYMGFKNMLSSNDNELSVKSADIGNKWGFTENIYDSRMTINTATVYNNLSNASATLEPKANLHLKDGLPFLGFVKFLDGRKLKRLRIVIEWQKAADVNLVGGGVISSITRPSLTVNEIINEQAINELPDKMDIQYTNIDNEDLSVDAISSNSTVQNVNKRLRAFNKKYLTRLLLINDISGQANGTTNYNDVMKGNHSMAFSEERINFRLNGRKLLAARGVDSPDCKIAMCGEVWGEFVAPLGSQRQIIDYEDSVVDAGDVNAYIQCSYGGVQVNEYVQELELEYERKSNASAYQPAGAAPSVDRTGFDMRVYGECVRTLKYDGKNLMVLG